MAADDTIQVQVQADVSDLATGMDAASTAVVEAMGKLTEAVNEAAEVLQNTLGDAADETQEKIRKVGDESETLADQFESLHSKITAAFEATGILIAYDAIEKVAHSLEEVGENATKVENMSDVLGINVEQYQALEGAADRAGVGMSMTTRTIVRLEEEFRKAGAGNDSMKDKLMDLGFSMEEINDKTLDSNDLITILGDKLRDTATHTATMVAVTEVFGARAKQVAKALEEYDGSLEGVTLSTSKLNSLNQQQVEDGHKLHAFWSDLGHDLSNATSKMWLYVAAATAEATTGESFLAGTGEVANEEQKQQAKVDLARRGAEQRAAEERKVLQTAVETAKEEIAATKAGTIERLNAVDDYVTAVNALYKNNSDTFQKALKEQSKAQQEYNDKQATDAAEGAALALKYAEKMFHDNEEGLRKSTRQMTKEWDDYYSNILKEAIDTAQGQEKVTLQQLDSAKKILDAQNTAKSISPSTYLEAEIVLINERRDAEIKMYQDVAAARGTDKDAAIKAQQDIAVANAKANTEIVAAQTKAAQDTAKQWATIDNQIVNSFNSALTGMLKGTATFHQTVVKELDNMAISVITGVIDAILKKWLAAEAAKIASSESGAAILKALNLENLVTAKATDTTQAVSQITTNAAVAASGAYASTVAIPYVGVFLAPAAAATADAEVLAFLGQLGAAEEGAIMPSEKTMMMLHPNEMVLPEKISKGIQEQFLGGPSSGGNAAGAAGSNTFHISAHDSASFEKYLSKQSNRNAVMKAMNKSMMRGNRSIAGLGNRGVM